MRNDPGAFDALASLFDYPLGRSVEEWRALLDTVQERLPEAQAQLDRFRRAFLDGRDSGACEELFAQTFDCRQETALEIGWHLHGESYHRGAFLVEMRERMRRCGVPEGTELPDHLGSVLRCLGRIPEAEAAELARRSVRPAVQKIAVALAAGENPFEELCDVILQALGAATRQAGQEALAR